VSTIVLVGKPSEYHSRFLIERKAKRMRYHATLTLRVNQGCDPRPLAESGAAALPPASGDAAA
jgi:hypothetical protein